MKTKIATLLCAAALVPAAALAAKKPRFTAAAVSADAVYLARLEFGEGIEQKSKLFESGEPFAAWKEITLPEEAREHEILHLEAAGPALLLVTQWTIESGGAPHVYVRKSSGAAWEKRGELPCTVLESITFAKTTLKVRCIQDDLANGTSRKRTAGPVRLGASFGSFTIKLPWKERAGVKYRLTFADEAGWPAVAEISTKAGGAKVVKALVRADKL